ncbi:MAG: hypothetical protein DSY47_04385 [Hydrogenothermus sp.]|nr:MAG: hypothetical protein DSY47_04385 [Hydrogenothermus sp.]
MREIEKIYKAYIDEIENPPTEEIKEDLFIPNKERILEMFKQSLNLKYTKEETSKIEIGNVYLRFSEHIPVYFVVFEEFDKDLYKVLKMSKWVELANHNDLIIKVNDEWFIVETWNEFFLKEEEIKNSIYYGKLEEKDFEIIKDFKRGKIKELPEDKRGIFAVSEHTYQIKFHQKESEIVREYKFRIFEELLEENVIQIPPEREEQIKLKLVAGKEKLTSRGDNFILFADKESNVFKLIFPSEIQGKEGILKVFDQIYEIEEIPEEIFIKTQNNIEDIDIEELAKNINIEVKSD